MADTTENNTNLDDVNTFFTQTGELAYHFSDLINFVIYLSSVGINNITSSSTDAPTTIKNDFVNFFDNVGNVLNSIGSYYDVEDVYTNTYNAAINNSKDATTGEVSGLATFNAGSAAVSAEAENIAIKTATLTTSSLDSIIDGIAGAGVSTLSASKDLINSLLSKISAVGGGSDVIMSILSRGLSQFAAVGNGYQDGVSETTYGKLMEESWSKANSGFFSVFNNSSTSRYKINFLKTTPIDPGYGGSSATNIYGNLILGVPPIFSHVTDPKNRAIAKTILRDSRFLTMLPGKPKYNGSLYMSAENADQLHQTGTADDMMAYLASNGFNANFNNKDKRYYTFDTDYTDYYAYLEAMLNPIWVKMGLATSGNSNTFNLFSFFNGSNSSLDSKYNHALGFFLNSGFSVSESVNNSQTSVGSEASQTVNSAGQEYQRINYLTGMGSANTPRYAFARGVTIASTMIGQVKTFISDSFQNTVSAFKNTEGLAKIPAVIQGIAADVSSAYSKDTGSQIQAFATTNGMQIVYPELWSSSTFTKAVSINYEFTSPYGDPLSIFQYVYVPFCALLAFAMPRQADANGFVSPFFVRASVPGCFNMDFGMISDFSWTRGGNNNLWTKDGLPRSISGSFSILDLYPYLAMTKRYSFLSANPNYTSFLDSLAGLNASYETDTPDALNAFWSAMLDNMNSSKSGLWNKYSLSQRYEHAEYADSAKYSNEKTNGAKIQWMRNAN
jgi:hypothetical protein